MGEVSLCPFERIGQLWEGKGERGSTSLGYFISGGARRRPLSSEPGIYKTGKAILALAFGYTSMKPFKMSHIRWEAEAKELSGREMCAE